LLTQADGTAEREAAIILAFRQQQRKGRRARCRTMTLGADKTYDTRDFVSILRQMSVRPHVAQNVKRSGGSANDNGTTRHASYTISQRKRPLIEKAFGWIKADLRIPRHMPATGLLACSSSNRIVVLPLFPARSNILALRGRAQKIPAALRRVLR